MSADDFSRTTGRDRREGGEGERSASQKTARSRCPATRLVAQQLVSRGQETRCVEMCELGHSVVAMTSPVKVLLSWSSGKDSAWCLHALRQDARYEVVGLLTTVNAVHERVAMHAVRRSLLEQQAAAAALPLHVVDIPHPCSNEQYDAALRTALDDALASGVTTVAFGDLFLEDVRAYREERLAAVEMTGVFPLWGSNTRELATAMVAAGLRAKLTCVDPRVVPRELAGHEYDARLLERLPEGVDPCGENGEFHSFVYAGPMLREPVAIELGEVVEREGFVFADLTPATEKMSVPTSGEQR